MFFSRKTPEQVFWQWFEKNEAMLHAFERDREAVFDALAAALKKV